MGGNLGEEKQCCVLGVMCLVTWLCVEIGGEFAEMCCIMIGEERGTVTCSVWCKELMQIAEHVC